MNEPHRILGSEYIFAISWIWVVGLLLASFLVRRAKEKALFAPTSQPFSFSEKWASGRSLDTWWSKLGGARNCLFVGVANEKVIIQPHFPFTLGFLPEVYGLDQRIPLPRILRLVRKRSYFQNIVALEFSDELGPSRAFELKLRNPDGFINAVQSRIKVAP